MDIKLLTFLVLAFASCLWQHADATCVLDSDFGFKLNCGFKKSGLFRVRNLGGVKGYVGLGFSVGDELGFPQALSTTDDDSKRRSVQGVRSNSVGVKPASAIGSKTVRSSNAAIRSNTVDGKPATSPNGVQTVTSVNGVKRKSSARSINTSKPRPRVLSARQVSITVPPFKPILPAPTKPTLTQQPQFQHLLAAPAILVAQNNSRPSRLAYAGALQTINAPSLGGGVGVPAFQALPASITQLTSVNVPHTSSHVGVRTVSTQQAFRNSLQAATNHFQVRKDSISPVYDHGLSDNTLTLRTLATNAGQQQLLPSDVSSAYQLKPEDTLMGHSIKALAQASNLSVEAITAAIAVRQQQLLKQQQQEPVTTTTAKPTTMAPFGGSKKYPLSSISKVMNAPKEYYPVGYDKNFDDNFASRVELPDTSFYCGDQKHFPGLYADEDLGCMVFHVCAFTDDGLIMKSFLCPESTLFDQTILKCNWWFYVDCKTSAKLYDSNIPISKSYQLMKALAFFSTYKKS